MTIQADTWCTVHYTTQDFQKTATSSQRHKGLGTKSNHFGFLFSLVLPGSECKYGYIIGTNK